MIEGSVTASREPSIELLVHGPNGGHKAIVDTGFDSYLTLPLRTIATLGLAPRRTARIILADGSETTTNVYVTTVDWNGQPCQVLVEEAETTPLVGTMLLDGHDLRVACTPGGRVEIKRLAS